MLAVAIEPVTSTFRALEENRRINGDRFVTLKRALAEESGREVEIQSSISVVGARVAAGAVETSGPSGELETEVVETISLDMVLDAHVPLGRPYFFATRRGGVFESRLAAVQSVAPSVPGSRA